MSALTSLSTVRFFCLSLAAVAAALPSTQAQPIQTQVARVAQNGSSIIPPDTGAPVLPPAQAGWAFGTDPGLHCALRLFGPTETLMQLAKRQALAAYNQGNHTDASRLLALALLFDPADLDVLRRLGFALKSVGRYEEAQDALAAALRRDPGDFNAWWWMGDVQRLLGDYDASVESLSKSVGCAPTDRQAELGNYVSYSEKLRAADRSWDHSDVHAEFADRHKTNRRPRRTILEFAAALNLAPNVPDTDQEGLTRLGWLNSQLGYTYAFLKEFEPAVMYFDRAAALFDRAGSPVDSARYRGALADALELFAESTPEWRDAVLDEALAQREQALTLAEPSGDIEQARYALGRLLGTLALRFSMDNPRVSEVREKVAKELPWRGPINEFSIAAIALGEVTCRKAEGDLAGVRTVIEMLLPFLDESMYLEDTERHARLLSWLAFVYNEQGHPENALDAGVNALAIIDRVRSFVPGDAFLRTTAPASLRAATTELARAALAQTKPEDAYAYIEECHQRGIVAALGSKIAGEAHLEDIAAEKAILEQLLPQLESHAAQLRREGKEAQAAWFDAAVIAYRRRTDWLSRDPVFVPSTRLRFRPVSTPPLDVLQKAIGPDAAYLSYEFGNETSIAVLVTYQSVEGFVLDDAGENDIAESMARVHTAFEAGASDDAALDELGRRLLGPVRALPPDTRLFLAPDGPLFGIPFEALRVDGARLLDRCTLTYTPSAGYLVRALARSGSPAAEALNCCSGMPCAKSAILDPQAAWTHATLCAGAETWLPNATDSAIVLADGSLPERFLYFGELLGCQMPAAGITLCLQQDWAADGLRGPEVQALLAGFAAAGATYAILNLWPGPCDAPASDASSLAAFLERKRALATQQPDNPIWARDAAYIF